MKSRRRRLTAALIIVVSCHRRQGKYQAVVVVIRNRDQDTAAGTGKRDASACFVVPDGRNRDGSGFIVCRNGWKIDAYSIAVRKIDQDLIAFLPMTGHLGRASIDSGDLHAVRSMDAGDGAYVEEKISVFFYRNGILLVSVAFHGQRVIVNLRGYFPDRDHRTQLKRDLHGGGV